MEVLNMHNVFLMTGSNVGDRVAMLRQAGDHISEKIGRIIKLSSFYETEPWGFKDKTAFVNQALEVLTGLAPMELLEPSVTAQVSVEGDEEL